MLDIKILTKYKTRAKEVLFPEATDEELISCVGAVSGLDLRVQRGSRGGWDAKAYSHARGSHVLCSWVDSFNITTFVEVGSESGRQAQILAETFPDLTVIAVDRKHLCPNLSKQYKNITQITGDSSETAGQFKNKSLDLVYIDADHTYSSVKRDLAAWYPKVKKNGIICGHDYMHRNFAGCTQAINEFVQSEGLELYKEDHFNWWCQKKNAS